MTDGPWEVSDRDEKLKLFFGDNFPGLVPDDDPAAAWFHSRVSGPEHQSIALQPPSAPLTDQLDPDLDSLDATIAAINPYSGGAPHDSWARGFRDGLGRRRQHHLTARGRLTT